MVDVTEQTPVSDMTAVSRLLQLESMARAAVTREALNFIIVNETRHLIPYRQAYLFSTHDPIKRHCKLVTASSIAIIERNSPFVSWLEKILKTIFNGESIEEQRTIDIVNCPEDLKEGWKEYSLPFVLWTPFKLSDGTFIGGLWLSKETPWKKSECSLMQHLSETYAHAIVAVTSPRKLYRKPKIVNSSIWVIIFFLFAVFFKVIRLSVLAPAEIVAKEPEIISSPMDGVIADIYFEPNTYVSKDETIFSLEDTNLRNEYNVVEKTLAVSSAKYRKAAQNAFQNAESKAQIALFKTQMDLQKTKLDYAGELLDKIKVKPKQNGVLIYTDKTDWIGRPVQVGERVMEVADPNKIQLKINLSVNDAIALKTGADVEVFLDADPLHPVSATVTSTSYLAQKYNQDTLTYRVYAEFEEIDKDKLRIGLQGTAKLYGENVSVLFYLFRRPLSYIRQLLGI